MVVCPKKSTHQLIAQINYKQTGDEKDNFDLAIYSIPGYLF